MPDPVAITNLSHLIDVLQGFQREHGNTRLHFQVVGAHPNGGAWQMGCTVGLAPRALPPMVVVSLSHPSMPALPLFDPEQPEQGTRYGGTCPDCGATTELVHRCAPKAADRG